ncbi:MAG: sugar phosphate isomerase/epimerase [Patescibacteria group bacterium]|nr:sugar phosphate isomerase/epimerase [Patescibacteria group bacterium]
MKIGMNMLLWTDDIATEHFPILGKLKKLGYDGVEIPLLHRHDDDYYRRLRPVLDDIGLACTTVTVMTPDTDPISPEPAIRNAAVDHLTWACEVSMILGSRILCGPLHSALGVLPNRAPTTDEMRELRTRAGDVLRRVTFQAQGYGVTLAIEFLNRFECFLVNTGAIARSLVDEVGHPATRMMWDTFHANIEENDPVATLAWLVKSGMISHVHLSANHRDIPGTGHIPWLETFRALRQNGYDGWLMIEAFGQNLPGLAAATKIWTPQITNPEEAAELGLKFIRETWNAAV